MAPPRARPLPRLLRSVRLAPLQKRPFSLPLLGRRPGHGFRRPRPTPIHERTFGRRSFPLLGQPSRITADCRSSFSYASNSAKPNPKPLLDHAPGLARLLKPLPGLLAGENPRFPEKAPAPRPNNAPPPREPAAPGSIARRSGDRLTLPPLGLGDPLRAPLDRRHRRSHMRRKMFRQGLKRHDLGQSRVARLRTLRGLR